MFALAGRRQSHKVQSSKPPMKFDNVRHSAELRELCDHLVCAAIGGGIAALLDSSWLVCAVIVIWAARSWKKKHGADLFKQRGAILAVLIACLLGLAGHWSSYRDGVFRGYDAAAATMRKPV